MLGIHVYFNNGWEMECKDVVNTRHFWRKVSKWCTRTNREPFFTRYTNTPMRVSRVEYTRTPNDERRLKQCYYCYSFLEF